MSQKLSTRALLDQLIAIPTVSQNSNLPIIDFIETYLSDHGIDSVRCPTADGQKAGIVAQVGPNVEGGIALSAHTDVVPVEGQAWVTDPWTVVEQDGRLYGRGTCDMKGFLAMALHALVDARDKPLKRPLQIAFSRDEEIGLLGAPDVAQALLDNYAKAEAVIVGEPTQMDVVTGHKSCEFIKVHVRGFEVHSSRLHEGVSAVMFAARFISWIHDQNVAAQSKPATTMAAMYDPPFTTLHTGVIQGGTASNITAKDCLFTVDLRCVGDENGEDWLDVLRAKATELQGEMQLIHPDTGIDFDILEGPSVAPEQGGRAEELARQFTGDNGTHTVSYGTDGGHFQKAGFSVVVCGPGSIEQAHQPNEFLEIAEFEKGQAFLAKVVHHLCQG